MEKRTMDRLRVFRVKNREMVKKIKPMSQMVGIIALIKTKNLIRAQSAKKF